MGTIDQMLHGVVTGADGFQQAFATGGSAVRFAT